MGKLHEILAVEGSLEGEVKGIINETANTFTKKVNHFLGAIKVCEMFDADDVALPTERQEMVTTVGLKLEHTHKSLERYIDVLLQKEATNQTAVADLVIDGVVLANDLPVTFLLGMEHRMKTYRVMYESIPTLQPGRDWEEDTAYGLPGVYKDHNKEEKLRSAKKFKSQVLYEATKEHPAHIEKWEEQVPVGKFVQETWSGMMSPAEKSAILGRFDKLIRALKQARQRANNVDIVSKSVGKELIGYMIGL